MYGKEKRTKGYRYDSYVCIYITVALHSCVTHVSSLYPVSHDVVLMRTNVINL